jgi:hypothetical protein
MTVESLSVERIEEDATGCARVTVEDGVTEPGLPCSCIAPVLALEEVVWGGFENEMTGVEEAVEGV